LQSQDEEIDDVLPEDVGILLPEDDANDDIDDDDNDNNNDEGIDDPTDDNGNDDISNNGYDGNDEGDDVMIEDDDDNSDDVDTKNLATDVKGITLQPTSDSSQQIEVHIYTIVSVANLYCLFVTVVSPSIYIGSSFIGYFVHLDK